MTSIEKAIDTTLAELVDVCDGSTPTLCRGPVDLPVEDVDADRYDPGLIYFWSTYRPPACEFAWYPEPISLLGGDQVRSGLAGYAYNATTGQPVSQWPPGVLCVARTSGDPVVSFPDTGTVATALHGAGRWDWVEIGADFAGFLRLLLAWQRADARCGGVLDPETYELSSRFDAEIRGELNRVDVPAHYYENFLTLL